MFSDVCAFSANLTEQPLKCIQVRRIPGDPSPTEGLRMTRFMAILLGECELTILLTLPPRQAWFERHASPEQSPDTAVRAL